MQYICIVYLLKSYEVVYVRCVWCKVRQKMGESIYMYMYIYIYIYVCMYIYVYSTHIHNNIHAMHGTHTKRRYIVYLHNVHTYYTKIV